MKTRPPKKVGTLGYFTIAGLIGSFTVVRESDFPFDNSYLNLIPFWICIFFISKFFDWIIAWNELYNYKNTIISKLGLEGKQAEAERKRIDAEARLFGLTQLIDGSGDDTRGLGYDGDGGNKGGSNGDGDDSKKDRDDGDESEEEKEMKKYFKEWWTVYTIGAFGGLIAVIKPDYWWVYIIVFGIVVGAIDTYFTKDKKKDDK